jgi:hypothetical protein
MEHLRTLHETGEIEWSQVSPLIAFQMAFMDDEPDDVGDTTPG